VGRPYFWAFYRASIQAINKRSPDELLVLFLAFCAALIYSIGQIPGTLKPLTIILGIPFLILTLWSYLRFAAVVRSELGRKITIGFWALLIAQLFWAFFRAPLDVDGIFYHLTTVLHSLQENEWLPDGGFYIWQAKTAPKMGVIPNLLTVGLMGPWGYRFAQVGHFSSAIIGSFALMKLARVLKWWPGKASVFGLLFFFTPIVQKQMTSNYVDLALFSYFFAGIYFAIRTLEPKPGTDKTTWGSWVLLLMASVFLLCGTKTNGIMLVFALVPFIFYGWFSPMKKTRLALIVSLVFVSVVGSCALWMVPNYLDWGNPIIPLQPQGLIPGSGVSFVSEHTPVVAMQGPVSKLSFSPGIQWFLSFFVIESVASTDMVGGAWGFVAIWAWIVLVYSLLSTLIRKSLNWKSLNWKTFYQNARDERILRVNLLVVACVVLATIANPGWMVPRYNIAIGFLILVPAVLIYRTDFLAKAKRSFRYLLFLCLFLQLPYVLIDRPVLRGTSGALKISENFAIVAENFIDILTDGEPQHPNRWLHFEYVPSLRRDEPREVFVGEDCVSLTALYWGRKFSNHVNASPACCRWPFPCEKLKNELK